MVLELARLWPAHPLAFWALLAAMAYLLVVGARLSWIDLHTHRLPNRIVFPAYAVAGVLLGTAALAAGEPARLLGLAAGGAVLWVFYFAVRFVYPAGMGFGDVKLAGVLGLYLGYVGWALLLWATFAAFLLGGLYGVLLMLLRRASLKTAIPFGPFMIAGTVLVLAMPAAG
ncbi:type IV leader peptidase [Arthrobacter crystallopoietes BAB-32]|uniref:Type IV leader peptidase n=1 Tax=Arthrobacter crystallopoietes BAB-32 TaxID=1246476 RepID=N1UTP5_9MICC|nr:A24 family peptidase [Arthrobacter crystallopoietes]EMY32435.1 type IV leader peptidase [Arthrobacter crystallopoietes BAB-32]